MYKKRLISWMLVAILSIGLLTGCQTSDSKKADSEKAETTNSVTEAVKETDSETATNTPEDVKPVAIKIWHDGNEAIMGSIEKQVNETLSADKITVTFEKKTGLTDQLKLYGNDKDNGPDMYFYAHDSLGTFVEMGIVAPLKDILGTDSTLLDSLFPMTVNAGTYQGEKYFLPVYFETLLFLYNKDLWQGDVPSTTEELYTYMTEHTDTKAGTYAVVNQHSTAYNVAPFINGYGGYIIDESSNPGLDNAATKEAIVYNQKFAALEADGDYNTVTTLFNEGKAQAIIGGPWLVPGIKEAGINLGIKSLSDFALPNGSYLAPYSGVQGVGVLKTALDKKDALVKVLNALVNKDLGISLAKEFNCAPATEEAYEDPEVSVNEMIVAIKDTARTAQPMPNVPQMSVMWGPAESLLAAINKSNASIDDASTQYQNEAKTAIADMQ
jgi:arabinogalactan oligomer/maltooligosaccharide transport system substrate-binding protein